MFYPVTLFQVSLGVVVVDNLALEVTETDNIQMIPDSGNCSASSCSLADSIDTNSCQQPGFIIALHRKMVITW